MPALDTVSPVNLLSGGWRSPRAIMLCALLVGLVLGAGVWTAFGGPSAAADRLEQERARLDAARPARPRASPVPALAAEASSHPLFALTTGPAAVPEVVVRLDGVSRSSTRSAALISIGGAPATWLERGKSFGGVTLVAIGVSTIVLETALGQREVRLAEGPAPDPAGGQPQPPPAPAQAARPLAGSPAQLPPGFRLPPPPASAPHP